MTTEQTRNGISELFAEARNKTPIVVIIDEVDLLARTTTTSEKNAIIAELLGHIDASIHTEGLLLIAGTNHPDQLDPALARRMSLDLHFPCSSKTSDKFEIPDNN